MQTQIENNMRQEKAEKYRDKEKAIEDGMLSLRRCAVLNALKGRTSLEEILRVTVGD